MSWKRRLAIGALAAGLCGVGHAARAEDPAPKKDDAPAAPAEPPKQKEPFFGDHFAMYLETRGGSANIDPVKTPVSTGAQSNSESELNFNGSKNGQFTVGWTLPRGRGQYLLVYNGVADGNFELNATGSQQTYKNQTGSGVTLNFLAPWWNLNITDGNLHVIQAPPVWNSATDDANGNGVPDPNEMRRPVTTIDLQSTTPKDLGNRIQTWDLLYRREFGGLKIRARWAAGVRYLDYQGSIPTPSWLTGSVVTTDQGSGYSDGVQNHFIVMQEKSHGIGPVGSGEVNFNFFRQRLTLYALVQATYLMANLTADSGTFGYLARDPGSSSGAPPSFFPGAGNIHADVTKSSWNTTFEAGVRVKILEGFHFIADWNKTGYLDTILVPVNLSIPTNASQTSLGTTATFISRDFNVSVINVGLSFQF